LNVGSKRIADHHPVIPIKAAANAVNKGKLTRVNGGLSLVVATSKAARMGQRWPYHPISASGLVHERLMTIPMCWQWFSGRQE